MSLPHRIVSSPSNILVNRFHHGIAALLRILGTIGAAELGHRVDPAICAAHPGLHPRSQGTIEATAFATRRERQRSCHGCGGSLGVWRLTRENSCLWHKWKVGGFWARFWSHLNSAFGVWHGVFQSWLQGLFGP